MRCDGYERDLPTGIFGGAMTNESHRYNRWTPTLQLHGDASNAVLRAVDEGTLFCIRGVATNLEIWIGSPFYRKAQHAAQQEQGAEAH